MKKTLLAFGLGAISTLSSYTVQAQFAMGADVSWLQQSEALGHKFYDVNGKQKDALVILKEKGVNSIRLRTWVNPDMNNPFSGHCSQKETIAMAVRCKNLGLRVMIDFHYNDTWTSVGSQETPKAWQSMTYSQMKTALYDYAYNFCVAMKAAGVSPEWFQNGNETNKGIVNPTGSLAYHPDQMTGLLNQGYAAIKKVFPNTKVLIHTAQPQKDEGKTMIDTYIKNGGKLDAIGLSSYASQGSSQTGVQKGVQSYYDKFGLEVIMVEIGGTSKQASLIKDWAEDNAAMNKPCKGGIFYWEPTASDSPFNWGNAMFDESQKATTALDGFLTKISTSGCPVVTGVEDEPVAQEANNYTSFYPNPFNNSLTIERNGAFRYAIYDITGLMVEEGSSEGSMSVGKGIAPGMYMVKIHADGKTSYIKVQKD